MHFEFEERLLTTFDSCSSLRIVLGSFCAIGNSSEDPIRGLIHSGDCHGREGNQIQVAFSSYFFPTNSARKVSRELCQFAPITALCIDLLHYLRGIFWK